MLRVPAERVAGPVGVSLCWEQQGPRAALLQGEPFSLASALCEGCPVLNISMEGGLLSAVCCQKLEELTPATKLATGPSCWGCKPY